MFGIINLPAFIAAGILLNLTPGPDTIYILGRSIAQGRKAGIYSALGISSGILIHITLAALGLSVIVARSAMAFNLIKLAGAFYLAYLGVQMLLKKSLVISDLQPVENKSLDKLYVSGILTNVLNPKVALFFLVFLPQFVLPSSASSPLPFFILGFIFLIPGTIWSLILAIFSSMLSKRFRSNSGTIVWINRLTAVILISLGMRLIFIKR